MAVKIDLIARRGCIAAVATALMVSRAHAAEFELGDGKLNVSGSVFGLAA